MHRVEDITVVRDLLTLRRADHGRRNRGCGGEDNDPHFWDQGGTGGTEGRSNENDLCFYSRQSLFSIVQVTDFQLP